MKIEVVETDYGGGVKKLHNVAVDVMKNRIDTIDRSWSRHEKREIQPHYST